MENLLKHYQSLAYVGLITIVMVLLVISPCRAQSFREMSQILGINKVCVDENRMSGGVVFIDFNNDHYFDLFIIRGNEPNLLYQNNWDGTFTNVSSQAGVSLPGITCVGAAVADIDNDGDDDLFITTKEAFSNILLENNGDGTFTDISAAAGITHKSWSTSVSFGDFNLDGLIDIYVNNYADYTQAPFDQNLVGGLPNYLYENQGNNTFAEVAQNMEVDNNGLGLAVTFTDCDQDGDPDLLVANDFGYNFEPNELYINAYPESKFIKTATSSGMHLGINAMGIAIGDFDEDEDFDYYITNIGDNPFFNNLNDGSLFSDIALEKQLNNPDGTSWGTAFIDYDNDSYLDLVVANGEVINAPHQNNENRLFKGDGQGNFTDVSVQMGINSNFTCRGLSCADYDNDGDVDMVFGVVATSAATEENILIYQNEITNNKHWVKVKLTGIASNKNGYGANIRIVVNGRSIIREVDGGSSYLSHHANVTHFGIDNYEKIDSLIVTWPGNNEDIFLNIPANKSLTVVENEGWFTNANQEIIIGKGDSVLIDGDYKKTERIYSEMLKDEQGKDSVRMVTKLIVDKNILVAVEKKQNFNDIALSAFPNPSREKASISYQIKNLSRVQLIIHNSIGNQKVIFENNQAPGFYEYELNFHHLFGSISGKGLYLVRLVVDNKSYTIRAINYSQ